MIFVLNQRSSLPPLIARPESVQFQSTIGLFLVAMGYMFILSFVTHVYMTEAGFRKSLASELNVLISRMKFVHR